MAAQIQLRRGTAAQWTATNPVLASGEQGLEIDTRKIKTGDGVTAWNSLTYPFVGGTGTVTSVTGSGVVTAGGTAAAPVISITEDATHRFTTDAEKAAWNGKQAPATTLAGYGIADAAPLSHVGAGGAAHANAVAAGAAGFMSGDDKQKLDGVQAGAQANPASTDTLAEGGANLYFTAARVRSAILTGLSTAAATVVDATHSVLQAIGFLQKQVSDNATAISGKQATLVSGTNLRTVNGNTLLGSTDLTISTTPGGSTTQVQFNDAGVMAGDTGLVYDKVGKTLAATSLATTTGGSGYALTWVPGVGLGVTYGGIAVIGFSNDSCRLTMPLTWSGSSVAANPDLYLWRDAANAMAQRNGTAAQAFRVYNTYTDASNNERAVFDWTTTANTLTVGTKKLGTGANRAMHVTAGAALTLESGAYHLSIKAGSGEGQNILFYVADGLKWRIDGSGALWTHTDNTTDVGYAAYRVRTLYVGTSVRGGAAGLLSLGAPAEGLKQAYFDYTNTATVGAVTINKAVGRVNIAASGTSVAVTNSLCTAAAFVSVQLMTVDGTAKSAVVVPADGSFTITLNAACTGQVAVGFAIVNTN